LWLLAVERLPNKRWFVPLFWLLACSVTTLMFSPLAMLALQSGEMGAFYEVVRAPFLGPLSGVMSPHWCWGGYNPLDPEALVMTGVLLIPMLAHVVLPNRVIAAVSIGAIGFWIICSFAAILCCVT
jgi:hypothetical protein